MRKIVYLFLFVAWMLVGLFGNTCEAACSGINCSNVKCDDELWPIFTSPGGDHPDETFAVDSGYMPYEPNFPSDPHTVVLKSGYFEEFNSTINKFKKSGSTSDLDNVSTDLLNSSPLFVIPSGGLYGLENSIFFKSTLD